MPLAPGRFHQLLRHHAGKGEGRADQRQMARPGRDLPRDILDRERQSLAGDGRGGELGEWSGLSDDDEARQGEGRQAAGARGASA